MFRFIKLIILPMVSAKIILDRHPVYRVQWKNCLKISETLLAKCAFVNVRLLSVFWT